MTLLSLRIIIDKYSVATLVNGGELIMGVLHQDERIHRSQATVYRGITIASDSLPALFKESVFLRGKQKINDYSAACIYVSNLRTHYSNVILAICNFMFKNATFLTKDRG